LPCIKSSYTLKQHIGTFIYDWPVFVKTMLTKSKLHGNWLFFRNRNDKLIPNPDGIGVRCDWQYTRKMHLCNVFPAIGAFLMCMALRDYPIHLSEDYFATSFLAGEPGENVHVSFLIGHRGLERLPHLLMTLASIQAQKGARVECIVVEQDVAPKIRDSLPDSIVYHFTPIKSNDTPYNRSWAFNVAARKARGRLLVCHDNDMLVPASYAANLVKIADKGYEVMQLKRFIFYLDESSTQSVFEGRRLDRVLSVETVIENLEGGGSVGIHRSTYSGIGGFDEGFVGWGGEDLEFWDRCLTRKTYRYAFLPIVHLWHPPQPGKRAAKGLGKTTYEYTHLRRGMLVDRRIKELKSKLDAHGNLLRCSLIR
jgi:hypothetical protein